MYLFLGGGGGVSTLDHCIHREAYKMNTYTPSKPVVVDPKAGSEAYWPSEAIKLARQCPTKIPKTKTGAALGLFHTCLWVNRSKNQWTPFGAIYTQNTSLSIKLIKYLEREEKSLYGYIHCITYENCTLLVMSCCFVIFKTSSLCTFFLLKINNRMQLCCLSNNKTYTTWNYANVWILKSKETGTAHLCV